MVDEGKIKRDSQLRTYTDGETGERKKRERERVGKRLKKKDE